MAEKKTAPKKQTGKKAEAKGPVSEEALAALENVDSKADKSAEPEAKQRPAPEEAAQFSIEGPLDAHQHGEKTVSLIINSQGNLDGESVIISELKTTTGAPDGGVSVSIATDLLVAGIFELAKAHGVTDDELPLFTDFMCKTIYETQEKVLAMNAATAAIADGE